MSFALQDEISPGERPASEADAKQGRESGQHSKTTPDLPLLSGSGSGELADAARSAARPAALPCQYRHNCPKEPSESESAEVDALLAKARTIGGSHRKTAYAVKENVGSIARAAGLENLVFFTPTLANKDGSPPDPARAQACWRKLQKMVVQEFIGGGVRILERGGKTLRLHYHVMLDVGVDVRIGYNFEASRAVQAKSSRAKWLLHDSANSNLRAVHDKLYRLARRAGFGQIFHCEPVRSEVEAIKTYLAKYICKHVGQRLVVDKRHRLVAYFGLATARRQIPCASGFAFGGSLTQVVKGELRPDYRNSYAWLWRQKVAKYWRGYGLSDLDQVNELVGPKWCYRRAEDIRAVKLDYYPYVFLAVLDGRVSAADFGMHGIPMMGRDLKLSTAKTFPAPATDFKGIRLENETWKGMIGFHRLGRFGAEVAGEAAEIMQNLAATCRVRSLGDSM